MRVPNSSLALAFVFALLGRPAPVTAEPPELRTVFPPGLQRDVEAKVQFIGRHFTPGMELVLPFAAEVRQEGGSTELTTFVIKPKETPTGLYPVRLRSAGGLSNMLLLSVDDLPRILEREP